MANLMKTLEGMANIYEKTLNKIDESGLADIYKKATEQLFENIKCELKLDLHFEDVEYLDGYYIFAYGTNSVVHFHIKEAPGWKFGIWWGGVATEETQKKKKKEYCTDKVCCEVFAQFEKEIDKFKPTCSEFCRSFTFGLKPNFWDYGFSCMCDDIKFIIKEPYLAFYKHCFGTDFNREYVSREKAKRYWNKHWKREEKIKNIKTQCSQKVFDFLKSIMEKDAKNGDIFIYDCGSWISPRYDIIVRNITMEDGKPLVEEEGCYSLFGDDGIYDGEKEYKKIDKECDKLCSKLTWFSNPFSRHCSIRNTDTYNKWFNEALDKGKVLYGYKDGQLIEGQVKNTMEE